MSSQQQQSEGEQQRRKRFREFKEERQVCGLNGHISSVSAFLPGTSVKHGNFVLWPYRKLQERNSKSAMGLVGQNPLH